MKTSYNWIEKHISVSDNIDLLTDKLTLLGLECSYKKIDKTFNNVIVGKIKSCKKHPDSDHLNICEVDVGYESYLQIICGAPNVKKDILVPVAPIGATGTKISFLTLGAPQIICRYDSYPTSTSQIFK
jgi:phenylalanyl-tRNA synthetase beta chain